MREENPKAVNRLLGLLSFGAGLLGWPFLGKFQKYDFVPSWLAQGFHFAFCSFLASSQVGWP